MYGNSFPFACPMQTIKRLFRSTVVLSTAGGKACVKIIAILGVAVHHVSAMFAITFLYRVCFETLHACLGSLMS